MARDHQGVEAEVVTGTEIRGAKGHVGVVSVSTTEVRHMRADGVQKGLTISQLMEQSKRAVHSENETTQAVVVL